MRTARPAGTIALLALALATAPAIPRADDAATRCTIPNAQDWREYRSRHFVVATDASRRRAAGLVEELEQIRALVIVALFGEDVDVPGRVRVVAFTSPRQFEELAPPYAAGYVSWAGNGEPVIVVPFEGLRQPSAEVVAHELAHQISWHHYTRQPRWFAEGLAQWVQTVAEVRPDPHRSGRLAGGVSPEIGALVASSTVSGAKELFAWRGDVDAGDPGRLHAGSWLLYHFLWNTRSKAFAAYEERLASGEPPAAAWRASFPDLDPSSDADMARLDRELAGYRARGRYAAYRVAPGKVDASFQDAPIPPADLHFVMLDARAEGRFPKDAAERRAFVAVIADEALREDPLQPRALAMRARWSGSSVAAALRPVTAARPADARGWLMFAQALDPPPEAEREAAFRKAIALAPDDAAANNGLAWLLVTSGRAREARPFAEHALDLAPWDPGIVDTLAAVAFGMGQCKPALALQRRAADLFPPNGAAGQSVHKRLAEYEATCGGAAGTGSSR